jgi:hypothetical protein
MIIVVSDSDVVGGTVVQWFGSYREERDHRPFIEVSHGGVYVNGYLDRFPQGAIDAALEAFHTLKRKPKADMSHLATHERVMGDLLPIEREAGPTALDGPTETSEANSNG